MKVTDRPSPNHEPRKHATVDILLLHYTGMPTEEEALARLLDPEAKVSAHYMIGENGDVTRLVPEEMRAWHAGVSHWGGARDVNGRSIGIELVNPGHEFGYRPFTESQMAALETLAGGIMERHAIPAHRVLGHSDVAPDRKEDPGELFDWLRLARSGIGVMPAPEDLTGPSPAVLRPGDEGAPVSDLQRRLKAWGYGLTAHGQYDAATECVVRAFQRHYHPERLDGVADGRTRLCLAALLRRCMPEAL